MTKDDVVPDVPNRPQEHVESETSGQQTFKREISVEPIVEKLRNRARSHEKNVPKGSHLIPDRANPAAMKEQMIDLLFHISTKWQELEAAFNKFNLNSLSLTRSRQRKSNHMKVLNFGGTLTDHIAFQIGVTGT